MSRLRAEDGMTMMEVLVAATAGFVVLAAALGLLDSSLRLSSGAMQKTDAMQRGRLAMDRITQPLRSQVCLNLTTPAILPGATADSVTFYSDFGQGLATDRPNKKTLTFDAATSTITESTIKGVGPNGGPFTFDGAPGKNLLLERAARQKVKVAGVDQDVPFLRYFAYQQTGNPPRWTATQVLTPPLSAAAAARVARIEVAFTAAPTGGTGAKHTTNLEDQVSVRHADPNLTVPDPMCV